MNPIERTEDRPRVASFLIDDILAPSCVPMGQCSEQSSSSADTDLLRELTLHGRSTSILFNQPIPSPCLPCYGKYDFFYKSVWCNRSSNCVLVSLSSLHSPKHNLYYIFTKAY